MGSPVRTMPGERGRATAGSPERNDRGCESSDLAAPGTAPGFDRLQREAYNCLNSFPSKVTELNALIESHMPDSVKTSPGDLELFETTTTRRFPKARSAVTTASHDANSDATFASNFDDGSSRDCRATVGSSRSCHCSIASLEQIRTPHGICKRRYYRVRGVRGSIIRRRPGPLGQILIFVASKLANATRAIFIAPSWYFIDRIISIFLIDHRSSRLRELLTFGRRKELKNAQCGSSLDWRCSLARRVIPSTCFNEDDTPLGRFITVMRPIAVQLITDTTRLKRWLQRIALRTKPPSPELVNATRTTETIDSWAYELFFHLKCLQVNRARAMERIAAASKDNTSRLEDEVTCINLWHRLVQLRNNYIILYETLYDEPRIQEAMPP